MTTRTALLAVAAIGVLALPAAPAGAETRKNCAAAWKIMSRAYKAKTSYKVFTANCLQALPPRTPPNDPMGCHDGSDCPKGRQSDSDPP